MHSCSAGDKVKRAMLSGAEEDATIISLDADHRATPPPGRRHAGQVRD